MPRTSTAYRFTATEKKALADGHPINPNVSRALRSAGYALKHLGGSVYSYARRYGEDFLVGLDGNPPARMSERVVRVEDDRETEYPSVTAAVRAMGGRTTRPSKRTNTPRSARARSTTGRRASAPRSRKRTPRRR